MRFVARKVGFYLVAAWAAITLNFFLPRLIPGNPVEILLARMQQSGPTPPGEAASLRALLGLGHGNIALQYAHYLDSLAHLNLGLSVTSFPESVTSIIASTLPWTLVLVGVATVISFVLGIALGAVAGWRRGTWIDSIIPTTTFLTALPYFWLALLLLYLLADVWRIFPLSGGYDPAYNIGFTGTFLYSAAEHAVLPAATIVISSIGGWLLGMRNMTVTTLSDDFVIAAEAKGLAPRRVMIGYAARNAILPSITGFAISLGFVVSGSIVMEYVFSYPGIGDELLQAVQNDDYPLMQGIFLVISLAVLGANLLVDLLYGFVDPRHEAIVMSAIGVTDPGATTLDGLAGGEDGNRVWAALRRLVRSRRLVVGAGILLFFVLVAIIGPFFVHNANGFVGPALAAPSGRFPLGTTQPGQNILAQMVIATRGTLEVGFVAGLIASFVSIVVGIGGGYVGGVVDDVLALLTNVVLVIPALPLVIIVAAYVKSGGLSSTILVIALTSWAASARVLRGQTLSVRNRDYVLAAQVSGERSWRIIVVEILPNELAILISQFIFAVVFAILTQAGLAFLGLENASILTWGNMLYLANNDEALTSGAWWWFVPPGLCIALVGTGLSLVNFALDEILNPRLRVYRAATPRRRK